MCGIVGFLDKNGNRRAPVGQVLLKMLTALGRRGPDSAGVALYGDHSENVLVLRIKLGEQGLHKVEGAQITETVKDLAPVVEESGAGIEVVSMGKRLEVVKQVGSPENLESTYGISSFVGTHGIGHTRMSTESRVDLSHSQPFWAHGLPDVAVVHNGHITNYHKLRRRYEQQGSRFYTENDSEIIGLYLARQLSRGMSFTAALQASLRDFDGSFSYLAATADSLGFVKDPFAFKPLVVAETPAYVALATEEIALQTALGEDFPVWEPGAKQVQTWQVENPPAAVS